MAGARMATCKSYLFSREGKGGEVKIHRILGEGGDEAVVVCPSLYFDELDRCLYFDSIVAREVY